MTKRIAFHTLGCKLNQAETSVLRTRLLQHGYEEVPYGSVADVLVINSCTVTDTADAECRQIIRRGLSAAPNAAVAVTGCYAQLKPEEIASIDGVKGVFGSAEKMNIVDYVQDMSDWTSPRIFVSDLTQQPASFVGARTSLFGERSRAYLKLQDGCDYSCTFCTIPLARGAARAMPFEQIGHELDALQALGYHEVVLTGINLGEYQSQSEHHRSQRRFVDVLALIEEVQPTFRVRISSIEPNTVSREILTTISQSSTIVPHLHIPLQSGSSRILREMKRRYNPDMYRRTIEDIATMVPNAGIGIDVIVGFPGETEEEFEESFSFIESLPFTYLHVFTYSERTNTPAARYTNQVPMEVRRKRTHRLRRLSQERQEAFARSQIGSRHIVISDTENAERNELTGISGNNVRITFQGTHNTHRKPVRVLVTGVLEGKTYGIIVE